VTISVEVEDDMTICSWDTDV